MMPQNEIIEMFALRMVSSHSIDKIVQQVPAACEKSKFAILQTFNYHEIVESKGFPIKRKVFIFEVCQAKVAAAMLTTNPEFSIFMPCKIAVYENEGQTIISTMNMEILLKSIQGNDDLYNEASTLFYSLKDLLVSLKNTL